MKVAVACDGLNVAPYFAQCTSYMCYTVERGIITGSANVPITDNPAMKPLEFLKALGADTVIVGLIEYDLASNLCHHNIEVIAGAEGPAADVVRAYVSRTLSGVSEPCSIEYVRTMDGVVSPDEVDDGQ